MRGTQFCEGEEAIPLCPVIGALSLSAVPYLPGEIQSVIFIKGLNAINPWQPI